MKSRDSDIYQKITVRNGAHYFSVFCLRAALDDQREEVVFWVDSLARRLGWLRYDVEIDDATHFEAMTRKHARFEERIRHL